jgi:hypothetical protein
VKFIPEKFWLATRLDQGIDKLIINNRPEKAAEISRKAQERERLGSDEKHQFVISQMHLLLDQELATKILEDFEQSDFKNTSSVMRPIKFSTGDERSSYSIAAKTMLYEHTMNVAYSILQKFHVDTDKINGLLYALLHDTGKSKKLAQKYNLAESERHEHRSAQYISVLLKDTRYSAIGREISKCLLSVGTKNPYSNHYYRTMEECDHESRHLEAASL